MTDLGEFSGPWWLILQRRRDGKRVDREDILRALASDYPVPDEAKPLLAAVVSREERFRDGNKPMVRLSGTQKDILRAWIDALARTMTRTEAKEQILTGLPISSVRHLDRLLRESET